MGEICLKHCLGHHMNRMRKSFKKLYKHVPRTWVLPVDLASLKEFMLAKRGKAITLICKPTHMCQGRGIYLTKKIPEFEPDMNDESAANKMLVVQQYIAKPCKSFFLFFNVCLLFYYFLLTFFVSFYFLFSIFIFYLGLF